MRKLDLTEITLTRKTPEGEQKMPYDAKDTMVDLLMHPELKLNGSELLRNNELAKKILTCKDDHILLEEAEYNFFREACNRIRGFTREDLELVQRILEAPQVEVTEKGE